MACQECKKEVEIVNKHFKLCQKCNELRLEGGRTEKNKNPLVHRVLKKKLSSSTQDKIDLDEKFYQECFNLSNHQCEECGVLLPTEFRDDSGKVTARWRYSHILPKSTFPELRHNIDNINHLCLVHHTQWDFGDKKTMKIYEINRKKFPNLLT